MSRENMVLEVESIKRLLLKRVSIGGTNSGRHRGNALVGGKGRVLLHAWIPAGLHGLS